MDWLDFVYHVNAGTLIVVVILFWWPSILGEPEQALHIDHDNCLHAQNNGIYLGL